jgi:Leucine-rich repeat (LRR) protein
MNKNIIQLSFLLLLFTAAVQKLSAQSADSAALWKNYTDIQDALKNPDQVYRLDLSNQFLSDAQFDVLPKFKNLRYLSLKDDHLKEIPKTIAFLTNLRVLDLSGNDFKFLPTELKKLKNLEEIFLNNDPYADINQEISVLSKLPNLKILHFENDNIGMLPKSISNLKHLEKLYLNDNEFTDIPDFLTKHKKLIYIDMKNNPLQWKGEKPFGITINF